MSIMTDVFDAKYEAWVIATRECELWDAAREKPESQAILDDGRVWLAMLLMKLNDQVEGPDPKLCGMIDEMITKGAWVDRASLSAVAWRTMLLEWGHRRGLPLVRPKDEP